MPLPDDVIDTDFDDEVISNRASDLHAAIARESNPAPPPELVEAVRHWYMNQAAAMKEQVAAIEQLLGFMETQDNLAVRIAKLEAFVLPKG